MTEQELDKMIARINELAHKSKKEGLTEEEAMEQTELRGKYIANFRTNFADHPAEHCAVRAVQPAVRLYCRQQLGQCAG